MTMEFVLLSSGLDMAIDYDEPDDDISSHPENV